ncbi:uncharacterized protein LOC111293626 [Durio zibethinus]|uniref:Uncharacterized protein LOC111293626 n=1 Tax=Durio zibethinus TaxID=66656 RepID=A0A6P5YQ12_DURZI|nr:uncharacterized protein LOC111293626 [Durio zibethinus]
MAASSTFESSLRRGSQTTTTTSRKTTPSSSGSSRRAATAPFRRSRSVSAFSRASHSDFSEFSIKTDNPLFDNNSNDDALFPNSILKSDQITSKTKHKAVAADDYGNRRGRSISRVGPDGRHVSGSGNSKESSRSLSIVDTRRRGRSVSRTPLSRTRFAASETEMEQEGNLWMKSRDKGNLSATSGNGSKGNLVRSSSSLTRSSQRKPIDPLDASPKSLSRLKTAKLDGAISTSSFSEDELMDSFQGDNLVGDATAASDIYRTVKSEVRRAISDIQNELENAIRSNATTGVAEIPPDLVNPGAVELVSDIQREYATKLEQSQERARQLRTDLAVEEYRGMELSRILKEVLPDAKTPSTKKSRSGRKSSIERRKISKCLTEDALAYFDECVSLSTFDGSDFSSLEDPPPKLVGVGNLDGDGISLLHANSNIPGSNCPSNYLHDKQECQFTYNHDPFDLTASNGCMEQSRDQLSLNSSDGEWNKNFKFSFSSKPGQICELQQDIKKYVKGFEKDKRKIDIDSQITSRSSYDPAEYKFQASQQSLLFDHVFLKNRHRWTGRFEAHLWDKSSWNNIQNKKGRQVYLGAYDSEEAAARTYDLAALKYWGPDTTLNFPIDRYEKEIEEMKKVSKEEYLASLRRRSSGFSRGVSKYRGVARHHHNGRWEARIGRVFGNKYLYLGTYDTQEEAAAAYDMAALEYRGTNAVTNFDVSHYIERLKQKGISFLDQPQEQIPDTAAEVEQPQQQQQQQQQEQQQQQREEAHKPQHFQYMPMHLPLCVDNATIAGMETTGSNELAWSFCMDSGLTSFLVPDFPLLKTDELPNLFDDTGFEDNIDLIFEVGPNQNEANRECVSGYASSGAMNIEEDNGKERLLSSSSSSSLADSPYSLTTSVSCNYSV